MIFRQDSFPAGLPLFLQLCPAVPQDGDEVRRWLLEAVFLTAQPGQEASGRRSSLAVW